MRRSKSTKTQKQKYTKDIPNPIIFPTSNSLLISPLIDEGIQRQTQFPVKCPLKAVEGKKINSTKLNATIWIANQLTSSITFNKFYFIFFSTDEMKLKNHTQTQIK